MTAHDDQGPVVREYLENAAQAIRVAVEGEIDDLRNATGLEVNGVQVRMVPVQEMGKPGTFVCAGVDLILCVTSKPRN